MLTTEKAPVLDADGLPLGTVGQTLYTATSSDTAVASVRWDNWQAWVYGETAGTATITATRLADGATSAVDVTVEAPAPPPVLPPFSISLGAPVPK